MVTLEELIEQKNAIEARISELRQEKRAEALREARHLVSTYQITADEIYGRQAKSAGTPSEPKYRDPETGKTWTGKGREPAWIKGKNREDFAI